MGDAGVGRGSYAPALSPANMVSALGAQLEPAT